MGALLEILMGVGLIVLYVGIAFVLTIPFFLYTLFDERLRWKDPKEWQRRVDAARKKWEDDFPPV